MTFWYRKPGEDLMNKKPKNIEGDQIKFYM